MKTKTVMKKLGHFRIAQDANGAFIVTSRAIENRFIRVVDQNGSAIALPMVVENDGSEKVSFHATTIKSLIQFLGAV